MLTSWLARVAGPAALAAAVIVVVEIARALLFGATPLGSFGQTLAFALAVTGLLGLPLFMAGLVGFSGFGAARLGQRWGRGGVPLGGDAIAARVLFAGFAGLVLLLAVQMGTTRFVKWFNKPVYQGLGAGLVAVGMAGVLALLSAPAIEALRRLVDAFGARLPAWADPTGRRGAWIWTLGLLIAGTFGAPIVLAELHTVDLRAPRLVLLWLVLLVVFVPLSRRGPRALWVAAGPVFGVVGLGALIWAAGALGASQSRLLVLDRDTLLAGRAARQLARLGDGDGDGVPRNFAGGDCDDTDPKIRPGVFDAPGDGIDQNCTGSDLDLTTDPLRAPKRVAPPNEARKDWHVVLITVDALRADSARELPHLKALAAESIDFRHAYSHGAATYWSLPALLASTMPSRLEMGRDQTPVGRMVLLTEHLRNAGYLTALFANVTVFFVRGLRQGAQITNYEASHKTVHGAKPGSKIMTDLLLRHVDRFLAGTLSPKRDKMHVWAHYYDPHDPYFEVPGYPAADGSDRARYDAITRYTDDELGRLVAGLKARGIWDKTVFIVTADHGDEFLDHGHRFHGSTLYDEMTRVPLIMHIPGLEPRVIDTPIGHMEVAPTLLELLELPIPRQFLGRSRAKEARTGVPPAPAPVFFEVFPDSNYSAHQVGLRLGDLKLIHRVKETYFELYDLAADPAERNNLFDVHPEAQRLRAVLLNYLDHHLFALGQGKTGAKLPPGAPAPRKKAKRGKRRSKKPKKPRKKPGSARPVIKGPVKAAPSLPKILK